MEEEKLTQLNKPKKDELSDLMKPKKNGTDKDVVLSNKQKRQLKILKKEEKEEERLREVKNSWQSFAKKLKK